MDSKDFFEMEDDVRYNLGANSYVLRIINSKNKDLVRFVMEENLDKDFGNFIKKSQISHLSWASRNPENHRYGIVTFNIPEKAIAYKVVFSVGTKGENIPLKSFSSVEEGKWRTEPSLSKEVLDSFNREINRLVTYYDRRDLGEGPVIFK